MEKALKKALAVVAILQKHASDVPNGSNYELKVRTRDASVLAVEVSSNEETKLCRFNEGRERWAWDKINMVAKVTQQELEAKLLDIDAMP
eukprot:5745253-Amphidinium_carterae.1